MIKTIAPKNTLGRFIAFFLLGLSGVFLSAFTFASNDKYMSRLEMATLMEAILEESEVFAEDEFHSFYTDLTKEDASSINKVLTYKLMEGFVDKSFRPYSPMRNMEVIAYLQGLTNYLRSAKPNHPTTKRLFRFLSYSEDPGFALEYESLNLPEGLENPNGLTSRELAIELANKLTNQTPSQSFLLSGKIINANTGKAISTAYISANEQAVAVDEEGCFSIKIPNVENSKTAEIFAAADGYQSFELRKNLNLCTNITIRLRPAA